MCNVRIVLCLYIVVRPVEPTRKLLESPTKFQEATQTVTDPLTDVTSRAEAIDTAEDISDAVSRNSNMRLEQPFHDRETPADGDIGPEGDPVHKATATSTWDPSDPIRKRSFALVRLVSLVSYGVAAIAASIYLWHICRRAQPIAEDAENTVENTVPADAV